MKTTSLIGSTSGTDIKRSVDGTTPKTVSDDDAFFPDRKDAEKSPLLSVRGNKRNSPQVTVRGNHTENQQWNANVKTTTSEGGNNRTKSTSHVKKNVNNNKE